MKTQIEIILETLAYYGEDPVNRRAYDSQLVSCRYLHDGKMCAVGRCMTPDALQAARYVDETVGPQSASRLLYDIQESLDEVEHEDGYECPFVTFDDLLKPEYRGQPLSFWASLQTLHDGEDHWADKRSLFHAVYTKFGHEAAAAALKAGLVYEEDGQ